MPATPSNVDFYCLTLVEDATVQDVPDNYCNIVLNPLESRGNYSSTSNNMKLVYWPLMGGLLHLVQRRAYWSGPQSAHDPPQWQSSLYHPSTASVPITVLMCNSLFLCGFNVPIKG